MKILIYIYYFLRSVFLRGLFNSLSLAKAEAYYEKKFGIHTAKIKTSDSKEFFHYQGASYKQLVRILEKIFPLTASFAFVDIGCGKGRALFVAEFVGYNDLTGIELDKALLEDAKKNLATYSLKKDASHFELQHANALDYVYKNKKTVYFLFNPFNEEILRKVLYRIVQETSSDTWFIYMNPLFPRPFEEAGMTLEYQVKTRFYTEAKIYRLNAKK